VTPRLFLNACGLVTPFGRTAATAAGVFAGRDDALRWREGLLGGRAVLVGAVEAELPDAPAALGVYASRNNRMMLAALDEIRAPVAQAIDRWGADRVAVVMGTSTSGIAEAETALEQFRRTGAWPAEYDYRRQELGSLGEFTARALGLTGPAYTIGTACASSAKVFAAARRLIRAGLADAAVVGGADTLCRMTLQGFDSLQALAKSRCNPFSRNRDGITIGEGAAAFLLSAAPGPVELLGVGESSDAHHPTSPDPAGAGARDAMLAALAEAGLPPSAIGYVNLHGTATALNDAMESRAMASVFAAPVPCSSTKPLTGHLLGACGGCEAGLLWLMLAGDAASPPLPPHLWDGQPDPDLPALHLVRPGERLAPGRAVLSNTFGFAGSNVSVLLARPGERGGA
jgi:3-oxoacyl-[acyl-carrier-protein] synthase-1